MLRAPERVLPVRLLARDRRWAFFIPRRSLQLQRASNGCGTPFVPFVGALMIALGSVVAQIIRHRPLVLNSTTVARRLFFITVVGWPYVSLRDTQFMVILVVVTIGVGLTLMGLFVYPRWEAR